MALASAALVLALGVWGPADHTGYAVHYGPRVMEGRANANDPAYHTSPAPCYVAYTLAQNKDMANLWLRIQAPKGTITCLVVDLPDDSKGDREALKRRDVWAELGWTRREICGKHWTGRARDCAIKVWVQRRLRS